MNDKTTATVTPNTPRPVPARLVFVALLPDGTDAFAFVLNGQPVVAVCPAGTLSALQNARPHLRLVA